LQERKDADGQLTHTHPLEPPPAPLQPAAYALTTPFPLYVVGPATSHTLSTLLSHSPLLTSLPCQIHGASTGNGESLARFILKHYNHLHYHAYFSLYEAPRLPFVPLIGNRSEQYPRLESGDQRLRKKGLLFLVGETRRDVIPRVLGEDGLGESERVGVEEVEVYRTGVMGGFEGVFREEVDRLVGEGHERIVVVVFSPSGCEAMLRVIGWRGGGGGEDSATTERNRGRFVVATIGPTTRDYLRENFGFEADVTARTPSPEGIWEAVLNFLKERGEVGL
jgi:uroporphyrinogen-III synthase